MADTQPVQPHKALGLEILNDFITRDTGFLFSLDSSNYGAVLGYQIVLHEVGYHVMARAKNLKSSKRMWAKA